MSHCTDDQVTAGGLDQATTMITATAAIVGQFNYNCSYTDASAVLTDWSATVLAIWHGHRNRGSRGSTLVYVENGC